MREKSDLHSICILQVSSYKIGTMEAELKTFLSQRTKETIHEPSRIPSAVLAPLYLDKGKYHLVFIRRSIQVPTHKGQVAFPGGARHKTDKSLLETALRETHEEIGVKPEDVTVLGELDDQITTTSNFVLTPFIGVIPWPYEFTLSKREVEKLIFVPLDALRDPKRRKPEMEILKGEDYPSYAYYYQGKRIWGATARVIYQLLEILKAMEALPVEKGA
jgi:8-oxo-dGTP pyrophosphatase MutT (NUDIX family)